MNKLYYNIRLIVKISQNMVTPQDIATAKWKKSKFCDNGACVEVAHIKGKFAIRDSKQSDSPVLLFTNSEWHSFILGIKNGDFE
ncbi:MAG TPA: DUF397 domain-containing protein [Candidatus Saccharimonadales bacterium]|nr:DUF397 domain-containing protein [Candidatus Saccharimonadales bacterium]